MRGFLVDEQSFAGILILLENAQYAHSGENEHAATIYSESNGKGGKTFSYNGSFEGNSINSNYHFKDIPKGATIEGFIHTHSDGDDFSKHIKFDDKTRTLDEDVMTDWDNKDFYLVNPKGQLKVRRKEGQMMARTIPRGPSEVMASGLHTGSININLPVWQDENDNLYIKGKEGDINDRLKKYLKKNK